MEIVIFTFADVARNAGGRIYEPVGEIVPADAVGLDVSGLGEHHRPGFTVPAPPAILAAAAKARTRRVRLASRCSGLDRQASRRAGIGSVPDGP